MRHVACTPPDNPKREYLLSNCRHADRLGKTATALEEKKKRKEQEQAQAAQVKAQVDAFNAAQEAKRIAQTPRRWLLSLLALAR